MQDRTLLGRLEPFIWRIEVEAALGGDGLGKRKPGAGRFERRPGGDRTTA